MRNEQLAETFVELADTLVAEFDLIEFLHLLVERCVELLEVTAAGLLLADRHGTLHVMASSTEQVRLLELFQLQNNDGPCLDCYRTGIPVSHRDLGAASERWPSFAEAATDTGFAAVDALPMRLRGEVIGALNLFNTVPGGLDESGHRIAQAMVDVATIGLLQERSISHHETLSTQLQEALNTRVIIEQAKGMLAERLGTDPGHAFDVLRAHARSHNVRLTELATDIARGAVDTDSLDTSTRGTPVTGG